MKIELKLIARHLVNQDIVQRGWHRVRMQFPQREARFRAVKVTQLVHCFLDGRDPGRFFGAREDFEFDESTGVLVFPPFRLEYFEQVVQFSREIQFEADLPQIKMLDLNIKLFLDFSHYPLEIPKSAPERYEKVFMHEICLRNLALPALEPFVESFADTHFARLEMLFAWRVVEFREEPSEIVLGQLEEQLFQELYGTTFAEALLQLRSMKFLGNHMEQLVSQQIGDILCNQVVEDGNEYQKEELSRCKLLEKIMEEEFSLETVEREISTHHQPIELFFADENESESADGNQDSEILFNDAVNKSESQLVASVLAEEKAKKKKRHHFRRGEKKAKSDAPLSEYYENLDEHTTEADESTQDLCATDTDVLDCFDVIEKDDVVCKQNVKIPDHHQFQELLNAAYVIRRDGCAIRSYNKYGLPYLLRLPELELSREGYIKKAAISEELAEVMLDYNRPDSKQITPNQNGYHVVFFVHGYQGNSNDLRFIRNLIMRLNAIENRNQHLITVLCKEFYKNSLPELSVYELGYNLATEVMHHMALNGIEKGSLAGISFVGFSLGNLVISACVQSNQFEQYLPYLRSFVSINGPHLGARSERRLVNFGLAFLKCFSGQKCITELENCVFNDIGNYVNKYRFLQAIQHNHIPKESLRILDILAAGSLNWKFERVILIGSQGDGYVREQSAVCDARLGEEKLLGHFFGTYNSRFILVTNKHNVYEGGELDIKTGRNIHINPLVSHTSAELIAAVCYEVM